MLRRACEAGEDAQSEYSEDPMEEQMREQLEAISMGLAAWRHVSRGLSEVCLAHHVLRGPPLVGLSRQNRLLQEWLGLLGASFCKCFHRFPSRSFTRKELLEELLNLRYWAWTSDMNGRHVSSRDRSLIGGCPKIGVRGSAMRVRDRRFRPLDDGGLEIFQPQSHGGPKSWCQELPTGAWSST